MDSITSGVAVYRSSTVSGMPAGDVASVKWAKSGKISTAALAVIPSRFVAISVNRSPFVLLQYFAC